MHQNQAGVNKVVRPLGQNVLHDVVSSQLEVRGTGAREPVEVEIGGDNSATGAHLLGQPSGNGASTGTDLEA